MSYLQSLSVFIAVAEEENFTAAAKKLNLTQPTVSFHIDSLEKQFGCPLVTRTSKGVTLTPYGRRLYESALAIDKNLKLAYHEIQSMLEGSNGHIVIGASTIPGEFILPGLIARFLRQHKGFRFTLITGDSKSILAKFRDGRFAIAVVGIQPEEDSLHFSLWDDELVLVGHPDIAIGLCGKELKEILVGARLIMRTEPSGSRRVIEEALKRFGEKLAPSAVVFEVSGNQGLKRAIIDKAGIGFISKWAVREELETGQLTVIPITGCEIRRSFFGLANPLLETVGIRIFVDYLRENRSLSALETHIRSMNNETE
ncbi:MAG: LysR family transcriptional regulator [Negativicutes bacterium]|nr:LysR family transcriptional regulator [Negativicutes bacterium]